MKRTVEICAAEGGSDSQMFVGDLANAYKKYFDRKG
ncbi:PCRF domain-containing protein [Thalassospira xiamenensis]|uniref:PCRF domain-containing protein n=1 Tax=Thalassospira xiamenensis TaxID=220697 RepID=A0A285TYU7_9PROT|nr:PCRF domain-containing protein [Thalassospira xiamenensis]